MTNNKFNKCVGVIISSNNIAAIEVSNKKGNPEITNYSIAQLDEDTIVNGYIIMDPGKLKDAIRAVFRNGVKGAIKTNSLHLVIPEESIFDHQITIPKEQINNLDFIKEKAEDFIPIELKDTIFDYKTVKEDIENKTVTIRFIVAKSSIITSLINIFKELKLETIGIKIDIDCLIRSFRSPLNNNKGDFLLLNLDPERDLISIDLQSGGNYKTISRRNSNEISNAIKSSMNLSSDQEVLDFCLKLKRGEKLDESSLEKLKASLNWYLADLGKKISNLVKATDSNDSAEIQQIYLTGIYSALPGVQEVIMQLIPDISIKTGIEYAKIPDEIEKELLIGMGICVNEVTIEGASDINLLPEAKKNELSIAPLLPRIKRYLLVTSVVLGLLIIRAGMSTTGNYIDYQVRIQEEVILNEHVLNPYLTSAAKVKQEKKKLRDQIFSILDTSVPISIIMESIDKQNTDGIAFQNVIFISDSNSNQSRMEIRAEINSRNKTEEFIEELKNNVLYENIESPLSNLLGKAERLVRVNLTVDNNVATEMFNTKKEPSKPNIPRTLPDEQNETEEFIEDDTDEGIEVVTVSESDEGTNEITDTINYNE